MGASLTPQQLGYEIPLGNEAADNTARRYLDSMSPLQLLLKLDFRIVFNSLKRDKLLTVVKDAAPELFRFVSSAYARPSSLFDGDNIIQVCRRCATGRPFGPTTVLKLMGGRLSHLQSHDDLFSFAIPSHPKSSLHSSNCSMFPIARPRDF